MAGKPRAKRVRFSDDVADTTGASAEDASNGEGGGSPSAAESLGDALGRGKGSFTRHGNASGNGAAGEEEQADSEERRPLKEFEVYADEAIQFHLVTDASDLDAPESSASSEPAWKEAFNPEFTHQFFGEDEIIFGYEDLKIDIWMHARTFHVLILTSFSKQAKPPKRKPQPEDLDAKWEEIFPGGIFTSKAEFLAATAEGEASFRSMMAQHSEAEGEWKEMEVREEEEDEGDEEEEEEEEGKEEGDKKEGEPKAKAEAEKSESQLRRLDLGCEVVRTWHARLQPLMKFFIDNGQPIDSEDPRWLLFVALERKPRRTAAGAEPGAGAGSGEEEWGEVAVAGICTVYRFFHYPASERLRVSQVLVLPPFQGRGHGTAFLRRVAEIAAEKQCFDVTVEDPSDALQGLREALDCVRLLGLPEVDRAVTQALDRATELSAAHVPEAEGQEPTEGAPGPVCSATERALEGEPNPGAGGSGSVRGGEGGGEEEGKEGVDGDEDDDFLLLSEEGSSMPGGEGQKSVLAVPRGLVRRARESLQINRRQVARCWEVLLYLRLPAGGSAGRRAWRRLLWQRLRIEEMGAGKEEAAALGKSIIDLDRWERGKQMFIMGRFRKKGAKRLRDDSGGDADGPSGSGAGPSGAGAATGVASEGAGGDKHKEGSAEDTKAKGKEEEESGKAQEDKEDKEDSEEEEEEGEGEEGGGLNLGVLKEMSSEEEEAARRLSLRALLEEREQGVERIAAAVQRMRQAEAAV